MVDDLSEIPEIDDLQSGRSLIRVPVEQNVPLTPRVRALIDTAEFQRLTEISQLGLVSRVYPGARHTRFEHALGVFHNALRYIQQLSKDRRFCATVDPHQAEVLIAASLLHDLGHWPFCHPIEDLGIADLPSHEEHAVQFLEADSELTAVLREQWQIDPPEILDILVPSTDSPTHRLLRSILSGPIDVDKMDYLERDSLHCGVPYGRNFDRQRLIQSLVLNGPGDGLAITVKGKTAAELMVFARYVMFSEVYWHHAVRSATSMFARAFFELFPQMSEAGLFSLTDAAMIARMREAARGTSSEPLLEGLFGSHRRLYKRAVEYSHVESEGIYSRIAGRPYRELVELAGRLAERLSTRLSATVAATDILVDAPPPHREVQFAIDVYFPKEEIFRPLDVVSPVVESLARSQFDDWVKRVRIFAAPHLAALAKDLDWDEEITAVLG